MVSYSWLIRTGGKSPWKYASVLTCKSLVRSGYRGERPIEPSCSWFTLKLPSGLLASGVSHEVKQMIRGIGGMIPLNLFSNFKCVWNPGRFA